MTVNPAIMDYYENNSKGKPYFVKVDRSKTVLWKDGLPLMTRLDMYLTERCNNNCVHCYINLSSSDSLTKKRELSMAEIRRILIEAVSLGCMTVRFTGGEPLLREDFTELYIFARKIGLKVGLFTNATLITPYLTELFVRIPPMEKIEVSVYGMERHSYEAVTRIRGSYDAAWNGINLLLKNKIPFVVNVPLIGPNKAEIEQFDAWVDTIPWMDGPMLYTIYFDLRCRRDNIKKNELIKKLRLTPEEVVKVLTRRKKRYLKNMQNFCSMFMGPRGDRLFCCDSGVRDGCIDSFGYFQHCIPLMHPDTIYDLKKGTLKDALKHFLPKLRDTKATNPTYLIRCANCFLGALCEQCPAKSWMEYGTLDTPVEYFCEVAHAQARFLGLINEKEKAWEVKAWKRRIRKFCK